MSNRIPALIAGLSTFVILIALGVFSVFAQMLIFNGSRESTAFNAMAISVVGQSIYLLIAVILARWLVNLFINKFKWNSFLAVLVAIVLPTALGIIIVFLAIMVTIPIAVRPY